MMCEDILVWGHSPFQFFIIFLDDLKGFIDAEVWNDESDIESVVGAFGMTYDEYYQAVEAVQYHLQGNVVDILRSAFIF